MESRQRIAREAARLLYTGASEEYKQAKEKALMSLGSCVMPSNYEVAIELDILSDENEGEERQNRIIRMRKDALKAMKILSEFNPRLIGSVWRGTARRGSDVDVVVYSSQLKAVIKSMTEAGYILNGIREVPSSVNHLPKRSHHIIIGLNKYDLEVVVRQPHEMEEEERCEIYGDPKRGLNLRELEKVMKLDPLRKFVPRRQRV